MGSAGWGAADDASDLDIGVWVPVLPSPGEALQWLIDVDVQQARLYAEESGDEQLAFKGVYRGVFLDIAWMTISRQERLLAGILSGEMIDRNQVIHAWNITHATPLLTNGLLAFWQNSLVIYPEQTRARLIASAVAFWSYAHHLDELWVLAGRRELVGLEEWFFADLQDGLRLLFAVNKSWEPDWKNLKKASHSLGQLPPGFIERLDDLYRAREPGKRVAMLQELLLDILQLVPPQYDVTQARVNLEACLSKHTGNAYP